MSLIPPNPTNSILTNIKKMLGVDADYKVFDTDIIIGINSALMALQQIGVGPTDGILIADSTNEWSELLTNTKKVEAAKSYIYLKVKLLFDPPTSGFVVDCINKQLEELAWRLMMQTDIAIEDVVDEDEEEEEVVLGDFEDE